MRARTISFTLNGRPVTAEVKPHHNAVEMLQTQFALFGARESCGQGLCGCCTVLVDGRAVASCNMPLWAVDGKTVTTIEGLGQPEAPHPLQQAFIAEQAAQCGYCTSGMLISAAALLEHTPRPTEIEVRQALDRNLCRCGSYNRAVRAVLRAAAAPEAG